MYVKIYIFRNFTRDILVKNCVSEKPSKGLFVCLFFCLDIILTRVKISLDKNTKQNKTNKNKTKTKQTKKTTTTTTKEKLQSLLYDYTCIYGVFSHFCEFVMDFYIFENFGIFC